MPVTALTEAGGYGLTWSADASVLYWTLGPELCRARPFDRFARQPSWASIDLELPADEPEGALAFRGARVITMREDEVLENATVVVRGNRIAAVGPADSVAIPDDAKVIDVRGKTVMPGLVKMHGHNDCCFGLGVLPQRQWAPYAALAFGVTTNFDPYTSELTSYETSEAVAAGVTVGPRWIGSGSVIYGRADKGDATFVPIRNLEDARQVMARKKALGGLFFKSYKQPTRQKRQQPVQAGREAGVWVDVEGESHFTTTSAWCSTATRTWSTTYRSRRITKT